MHAHDDGIPLSRYPHERRPIRNWASFNGGLSCTSMIRYILTI